MNKVNIHVADNNTLYFDWLYTLLNNDDAHTRLLGWLIARSLFVHMREKPRWEVAKRVLAFISHSNVGELSGALTDMENTTSVSRTVSKLLDYKLPFSTGAP